MIYCTPDISLFNHNSKCNLNKFSFNSFEVGSLAKQYLEIQFLYRRKQTPRVLSIGDWFTEFVMFKLCVCVCMCVCVCACVFIAHNRLFHGRMLPLNSEYHILFKLLSSKVLFSLNLGLLVDRAMNRFVNISYLYLYSLLTDYNQRKNQPCNSVMCVPYTFEPVVQH